MNDTPTSSMEQDSKPKLRCPNCSFMVPLPADECPECKTNLRTGERPIVEVEPLSNRAKIIAALIAFVIVAGLAAFFFSGTEEIKSPQKAAPVKNAGDPSEAVDLFQELSNESIGAKPGIIVNRTKESAEQIEKNRKHMDDVFLATE